MPRPVLTTHIAALFLLFLAQPIGAQEVVPPGNEADTALPLMPERGPQVSPAPVFPDPTLSPQTPDPSREGRQAEAAKKSETEAAEDALQARIRYRRAKTRALQDPKIQAELASANGARTDLEKREGLKRYYKMLFTRMAKLDRSLKPQIQQRQDYALRRLTQTRLDPSEPLDAREREVRYELR